MFSTLNSSAEGRTRRGLAYICGVIVQFLMMGTAFFMGLVFPSELQLPDKHCALMIWLQDPALTTKPVAPPPRKVARVYIPEPKLPEPPEFLASSVPDLDVPKIRHTISSASAPQTRLPDPPVPQPSPAPKMKEQVTVHTGLFGGAAEPVTTKRAAEQVQTGGFGSPHGFPGQAQYENSGNVPKLGSFGVPEGPGTGNGTGGRHGIQGVIASTGFGSAVAGGGNGRGDGGMGESQVTVGGFEKARLVAQAPAQNLQAPSPADFQTVEILSKPSPLYTEEARELRIQGDVALSVVFQANGAIKVTGVVRSLGHGLDQAAERAATQIRFKPAKRDGLPTDFPAILRIEFRLADQST
jgi:TonB family protein